MSALSDLVMESIPAKSRGWVSGFGRLDRARRLRIQIVSARLGRVTGQGLAANIREHFPAFPTDTAARAEVRRCN